MRLTLPGQDPAKGHLGPRCGQTRSGRRLWRNRRHGRRLWRNRRHGRRLWRTDATDAGCGGPTPRPPAVDDVSRRSRPAPAGPGRATPRGPAAPARSRRRPGRRRRLGPSRVSDARFAIVVSSCVTASSARARACGLLRVQRSCSASRMACSTARSRPSIRPRSARGTRPAASQRSWIPRRATARRLDVGDRDSASASASRASLAARFSRNSASVSDAAALRAAKKASWAARKRAHRASSSLRAARPAAFHRVIRSRYAAAVAGPQSVEVDSVSASATSSSLAARARPCCSSRAPKCADACGRTWCGRGENRFHRSSSVRLSSRDSRCSRRHSSNSSRSRSPDVFHGIRSVSTAAIVSASSTSAARSAMRPLAGLLPGLLGLGAALLGHRSAGPRAAGSERLEVADRVGASRTASDRRPDRRPRRRRRRRDRPRSAAPAGDLGGEVVELAGEVRQGLLLGGARVLPDRTFAVRRTHPDGAVVVHAAPLLVRSRSHASCVLVLAPALVGLPWLPSRVSLDGPARRRLGGSTSPRCHRGRQDRDRPDRRTVARPSAGHARRRRSSPGCPGRR